jgi:hypothetical protein
VGRKIVGWYRMESIPNGIKMTTVELILTIVVVLMAWHMIVEGRRTWDEIKRLESDIHGLEKKYAQDKIVSEHTETE